MNKKGIVLMMLALLSFCLIACQNNSNDKSVPLPDSIIVYSDGTTKSYEPDSALYVMIYDSLKVDPYNILETMVDEDTVEEAKRALAIEYIYNMDTIVSDTEINCSKILFFLSGWCEGEAAFFHDDKYESGTVSFSCTEKQRNKIIESLNN